MTLLIPLLTLALGGVDSSDPASHPVPPPAPRSAAGPDQLWHLPLAEAIRIGLVNSEVVRLVGTEAAGLPGDPTTSDPHRVGITITRVKDDGSLWNFKAAIMAHVRSVEQQYWALSQMQITLWSRETAVLLISELRQQARADLDAQRIKPQALIEVEQALENAKLNVVTATSDLTTTERQLRNILGLAALDDRRIVPDTAPTEAKVDPDWDRSVQQMLVDQPDIALGRERLAAINLREALASGLPDDQVRLRDQREAEQAQLRQVVHQATHALARFYLEIDTNYKQFRAAQQLREAAQQRLEVQRAAYDRREITIDRVLDAVTQFANGFAQEAQYRSSYNTSLAALEEARGSLLAADRITVADQIAAHAPITPKPAAAEPVSPAATSTRLRVSVAGVKVLDVEVERTGATVPR